MASFFRLACLTGVALACVNASPGYALPSLITSVNLTRRDLSAPRPMIVKVNETTNKVYVSDMSNNRLVVVNGMSNSVVASVMLAGPPKSFCINPVTNKIYVVVGGNSPTIQVVNGATDQILWNVSTVGVPQAVTVNPAYNEAYVACSVSDSVNVIDGTTDYLQAYFQAFTNPSSVAYNPAAQKLYVSSAVDRSISIIDIWSYLSETWLMGRGCDQIVSNNILGTLWVAQRAEKYVLGYNPANFLLPPKQFALQNAPWAIDVDDSRELVYATIPDQDSLMVFNGVSGQVEGSVSAGDEPCGVAVNTTTGRIYVANAAAGTLSVYADGFPSDRTAPVISAASLTPDFAEAGEQINVLITTSDNSGVASVTIGGIPLTPSQNNTVWSGSFPASASKGINSLRIVALDTASNVSYSTLSYRTAGVLSMSNASALMQMTSDIVDTSFVRLWGSVETVLSSMEFAISDSSASQPIRVVAPGHAVLPGDFVVVKGRLSGVQMGYPVLTTEPAKIKIARM